MMKPEFDFYAVGARFAEAFGLVVADYRLTGGRLTAIYTIPKHTGATR